MTHIKVLPAGIGNATVIIKTIEYHNKIITIINEKTYTKLNKDLTPKI